MPHPVKAMFPAAGLPLPDDPNATIYVASGKFATSYARQVLQKWQTGDDASIAAVDMARVALEVDSSRSEYPLSDLPWAQDFDTNIASYEHPILALSFMPAFSDWAEVKEAEFFCEPSDRADWQIFIESESGSYSAAPVINELDPAIYLLITKPLRRSQGQTEVELGDYFLYCDRALEEVRESKLKISASLNTIHVEVLDF